MGLFIIDDDRCLNYNYKKTECHNCRDICPQSCWDADGRLLTERCNGCGLCQSVCPVDAIGVEGLPVSAWNELIARTEGPLHLSCRRLGTGKWSCLGFLNAQDLVALAWPQQQTMREVFLYIDQCRDCRPEVGDRLSREMAAANRFLARAGGEWIVSGSKPPLPESETRAINRRSFFNSLLATGMETARNVMWPESDVAPLPKAVWRSNLLQGRSFANSDEIQDVFSTLTVTKDCIACGLCAKICPVQSLTSVEKEAYIELWHEPLTCTGCGLCAVHCPVDCLTLRPSGQTGRQKLIVQEYPRCNECGEIFRPAGLQLTCFDCLMKGRQDIFGP